MPNNVDKFTGTLIVTLGCIMFLLFVGPLVYRLVGAAIALVAINYGLALLGKPKLHVYVVDFFQDLFSR